MKRISVSDCTLRQLCGGSSHLLFREKLALATGIARCGADILELPPLSSPKEDRIVSMAICRAAGSCTVAMPAGMTPDSVAQAASCLELAQVRRLIVSVPVSTVQMEYVCHMKSPAVTGLVSELCASAAGTGAEVEFEALDATRADADVLISICKAAVEAGAGFVSLCDDAGVCLPGEFADLTKKVRAALGVPVTVKVSDAMNMAVADALAALGAGADGVKTSIEAGQTLGLDQFARALRTRGEDLGIETGLDFTAVHSGISSLLSGLGHADQPTVPEGEDARVFLDAQSTIDQVVRAVRVLGYDLSEDDNARVFEALKRVCEKKSTISSRELEAIIASCAMQVPATYTLKSYVCTSSNLSAAVANVVLEEGGEKISGAASGDGPIDSAFMAIEQCIGHHYELDDFQIQAVTEGREALGSALVRLRSGGKLYSGNGLSADIVGASIRAYINALNKIVYEERAR